MLRMSQTIEEDSYKNIVFEIIENGTVIGGCSIMVDDSYAYCERIDIDEQYRNRGYGAAALNELSEIFNGIVVAPDNKDAKRLYDRLGYEYSGDGTEYIDQGYGVYKI